QVPARVAGTAGMLVAACSVMMPWAYPPAALDNVTFWGAPSPLQWHFGVLGVLGAVCFAVPFLGRPRLGRWARIVAWNAAARAAALGALGASAIAVAAIAIESGGLVNTEPGIWVGFGGSLAAVACGLLLPDSPEPGLGRLTASRWLQILGIAVGIAAVLFAAVFLLSLSEGGEFFLYSALVVALIVTLKEFGIFGWLATAAALNKRVLVAAAFAAAFVFPFTQGGSDANMSIAAQVLVFAATALGLNIVIGLVGLLDLGYIAFLGAGAFTAAMLSGSAFATIGWEPPFLVTALISAAVASVLGLLIGSPTLRVSGDYLAIVTLAFGEIFRITMINLDGTDGPNLTHGPNGIPGIPNLTFLGFDFGETQHFFGIETGRFANYFWLMLLVLAFIILVFTNLNRSRIGRGWVAIREDELAAEAMGVNTFSLKLLAFAGGAFLAGLAGAVKAHQDTSVVPEQYVFLESAFLVAAVVLGGMGTVMGVLIGATILKVLPEKLRFFSEYRLLLFGLLMVFMMRFRPEGIIADERRQLEFHEEDEELAEEIEEELIVHHAHYNPDPKGGV
ncbi:MAG: branched-chain amino acid ABC transporter permease, partial [Propionibacteriaceae bacterium]|nr:branched-chain amino acid ABC transporter permease [Propionibacteriaceae bacterium]